MRNTLIDAGPLIALFDASDQYHSKALEFLREYNGQLWTTWPVVTEVSHMLDFSTQAQVNFLKWVQRGGLNLFEIESEQLKRIIVLSSKFNDVPMDLADATLVLASEQLGIHEIVTIDSDFYIYRDVRNKYLTNIFL